MKSLNLIAVILLVMSSLFCFGQGKTKAKSKKIDLAQPMAVAQPEQDYLLDNFNSISNATYQCNILSLHQYITSRRSNIDSKNDFPEFLSRYVLAKSFVEMDERLLNCATGIIDSLVAIQPKTTTVYIHDTIYKAGTISGHIGGGGEDCTQNMIYLAAASGSLILLLLLLLYKFIRAHKIFKDLYDKIYDKILDELAEKFLVGIGIKEDEKFKDKIKKLVELNQRRKNGEMKLDEYVFKVEVVLE
jgi:hypothetical protein